MPPHPPLDPHALLARPFAPVTHDYAPRDTILYAVGLGLGADPTDPHQLRFVYEDGLQALPTMANILGYPGFWAKEPDTGIDWRRVVHAEQHIALHAPLPTAGRVIGHTTVTAFHDKGPAKGAIMASERRILDAHGNEIAKVTGLTMLRGDGGSGITIGDLPTTTPVPDRTPDATCDLPIPPQAALIYRLSGDLNPLHADPAIARAAGFDRPILHGMATMGVACHAILRTLFDSDPAAIRSMRVRFTAPVYPGETLRTEMWREPGRIAFRATIPARAVTVLDRGSLAL